MVGNGKLLALVSVGLLACGSDGGADTDRDPSREADAALSFRPGADAGSDADASKSNNTCATVSTGVELQPVNLAFAFDVSGSMGNGDKPYYDKSLKWDPVVAATKTFFASESSRGLSASLTFFPGDNARLICSDSEYTKPDVALTGLPSASFAAAIDAITPKTQEDWRSGTPTLAVMRGTSTFVANARKAADGKYVIVLVTDGYPQSCGSTADNVDAVVAEAKKALGANTPTYVIGVANPAGKGGPDTVSDLHRIAKAGGTEKAVLIDTGDPTATATAFSSAIDQIRAMTISCNVAIPEEDGFDKQSVIVHYEGKTGSHTLRYDKSCASADAWKYDNADDPKQIVLCDQTCDAVRADGEAELSVEFACEHVLVI